MIERIALFLVFVFVLSLTVGCARGLRPTSSPAPTRASTARPTEEETREPAPTNKRPTGSPASETPQPPVDLDAGPSHPAARARLDLARRLRIEAAQIEVVEASSREIDAAVRACLDRAIAPDGLLDGQEEEVVWIVLAVGGKRYHYLGVGELIVYCG